MKTKKVSDTSKHKTIKVQVLPKGSKLSLIQTNGLEPGSYPLYNLMGLTAAEVQCIVDSLTVDKSSLAPIILRAISTIKLFHPKES